MPAAHYEIDLVTMHACDLEIRILTHAICDHHRDVQLALLEHWQQVLPILDLDVQAHCGMIPH